MKNMLDRAFNLLSNPRLLKRLCAIGSSGYLYETGWINSYNNQMPIDKNNNPLPWVTYSFIDFIKDRLDSSMNIFEYGSGNSTLWYSKNVASVTSVEHDIQWFNKIKKIMPKNVRLYHQALEYGGDYSQFINQIDKNFDIVIVDGRDRVNCLMYAIKSLKKSGVVVLDDSERESYNYGIELLLKEGFKRIDFWGISPGLFYKKCTTIFYKNENCLGI